MFSFLILAVLLLLVVGQVFLFRRIQPPSDNSAIELERHRALLQAQSALETRLREEIGRTQARQAEESRALREEIRVSLESIRGAVDQRLQSLQQGNERKLDQMRQTVDEKLQGTLEKRLGESFRLVSERLEQVQRGLGEMSTLASGVGDLKRVLSNVTTRGAWGEVQLESILQQMLSPEQFDRNVSTKGTAERVEFAIKLPGANGDGEVWLPVDAKFPMECYQRLAAASERGDAEGVETCSKELETVVKNCAKTFSSKYLAPPRTTDFGILFLATEGLYAETLRRAGLMEFLQREHRVILAGPTTFAAILNSLQMGFRTLAIQKRSGEVWKVLGEVKTEFNRYGDVLAKVKKKIDEAGNTIDEAERRTRQIEKKLRGVQDASGAEDTPEEIAPAPMQTSLHIIAASGD